MGSGTVCWFQAVPVFSWSGRGVEPHWPHVQWLSCNPSRTEGDIGPRCCNRQDLIQANLVLAGGGWQGNSQSSQCLVATSSQQAVENWQLGEEGRWPQATEEGGIPCLALAAWREQGSRWLPGALL